MRHKLRASFNVQNYVDMNQY
jgi:hypothetical protein